MSNNRARQNGFSLVEISLVLAVVVVLGLIGWGIWQNRQTASKATTSTSSATAKQPSNTLTIKEWGVKLDVGSVSDATYKLVGNNMAYLTTTSMTSDPKCYYAADRPAFMALVRGGPTDQPMSGDFAGSDFPTTVQAAAAKWPNFYIKAGSFYYYKITGNGSSCGNADENNLDTTATSNLSKIQLVQ
jgi:prepilin-type N-terminal cleavage/methylation domain-containing protein